MRIRVMTFNLRFDTAEDAPGGNRWAQRLDSVLATVHGCAPDVIGFQEALRSQLADLSLGLPDYTGVGKPREAGDVGEYVPLFFRTERFTPVEYGDFWLSDTPEVEGSLGWDAPDPRHCTWALLDDIPSGQRFAAFNTHLDRWGEEARLEGARLIVARTSLTPGVPFLVMGDFNAGEDSPPLEALRSAGLVDTFRCVHPDATDVATVHDWGTFVLREKIDFVMADSSWHTLEAGIVREPAAGRLPSDHYPVYADVQLLPHTQRTDAEESSTLRAAYEQLDLND